MPDAVAYFTGQTAGSGFSYTAAWGGRPSVVSITAPLAFGTLNEVGDVRIRFQQQTFVIPQCRVARINSVRATTQGGEVQFLLEDRRWKWQYGGYVDGDYNVKEPGKARLREKSARQLAAILFESLGEDDANVNALPDNAYPRAEWYAAKPLDELERLCESFGCVVVYNVLADRAEVHKIGQGAGPPNLPNMTVSQTQTGTLVAPPDGIRVVGGQALFQSVLEFHEAVGEDTDGTIKPIDELSYKPAEGWGLIDPGAFDAIEGTYTDTAGIERKKSDLAREWVYRAYRLTKVNDGWSPAALQGTDYQPTGRDDIDPILSVRLEPDNRTADSRDQKAKLPAKCRGVRYDERFADRNTEASHAYDGNWSIDNATKILRLADAAFRFAADDNPSSILPAQMNVVCAYGVRSSGVPVRYEKFRINDGATYQAGEAIEHHPEIVREVVDANARLVSDSTLDNLAEVEAAADYYLDAMADLFVPRPAVTIDLTGIRPFSPDGLLRSVSWSLSAGNPPTTQLSYNGEPNPYVEPWEHRKERRERKTADEAARRVAVSLKSGPIQAVRTAT